MNPALMALYLDQNGQFNRQAYNKKLEDDFYLNNGMQPPEAPANMDWLENYKNMPVPGTRGAVEAPQLPSPAPVQQKPMSLDEEYATYGTLHGITPDPNSHYDTAETSPAPPGSEGYMGGGIGNASGSPIQNGAQAAMQATRASYEMDEEQRKRALGLAMVKFFSAYGASDNQSRLGALNEAFNPAVDAFIGERDKMLRHNYDEKKFEADQAKDKLDMDLKLAEHKRKMAQEKFHGMTPYQQSRITGDFHKRYADLLENKRKEFKESSEHIRGSSEAAEAKREKIREKVNKRWERAEKALLKDMSKFGLDIADIVPEDVDEDTSAAPAAAVPAKTVPNSPLSIAELQAKLAALKAQGR